MKANTKTVTLTECVTTNQSNIAQNTSLIETNQQAGYSASTLEQECSLPCDFNRIPGKSNPLSILESNHPHCFADIKQSEIVLILGRGGGFDPLLAAQHVGSDGRIIGIEANEDMVVRAQDNADQQELYNVEYRQGVIGNLPIPDNTVDLVIANGIVAQSEHKQRVFDELYRVLIPGGRLAITDLIALEDMPISVRDSVAIFQPSIRGAITHITWTNSLQAAGFHLVTVCPIPNSRTLIRSWAPATAIEEYILRAQIGGVKPIRNID